MSKVYKEALVVDMMCNSPEYLAFEEAKKRKDKEIKEAAAEKSK